MSSDNIKQQTVNAEWFRYIFFYFSTTRVCSYLFEDKNKTRRKVLLVFFFFFWKTPCFRRARWNILVVRPVDNCFVADGRTDERNPSKNERTPARRRLRHGSATSGRRARFRRDVRRRFRSTAHRESVRKRTRSRLDPEPKTRATRDDLGRTGRYDRTTRGAGFPPRSLWRLDGPTVGSPRYASIFSPPPPPTFASVLGPSAGTATTRPTAQRARERSVRLTACANIRASRPHLSDAFSIRPGTTTRRHPLVRLRKVVRDRSCNSFVSRALPNGFDRNEEC